MNDPDEPRPPARRGSGRPEAAGAGRPGSTLISLTLVAILAGLGFWYFGRSGSDLVQEIPAVVGHQYAVAEARLADAGFTEIRRQSVPCWAREFGKKPACSKAQHGKVLVVEPKQGTRVSTDTSITLRIGKAPRTLRMPDLRTLSRSDAERVLRRKQLVLSPSIAHLNCNDPARAGRVAAHNPPGGASVTQGDVVRLAVYGQPAMVEVKDYVGQLEEVARAGLQAAGFAVSATAVASGKKAGTVVQQRPRQGEAVKGSTVTIAVSDGSADPDGLMTMPDVVGLAEREAKSAIREHGHVGSVYIEDVEAGQADHDGLVMETDPAARVEMRRADAVTLYVGKYLETSEPPETTSPPSTTTPPWPSTTNRGTVHRRRPGSP